MGTVYDLREFLDNSIIVVVAVVAVVAVVGSPNNNLPSLRPHETRLKTTVGNRICNSARFIRTVLCGRCRILLLCLAFVCVESF